MPRGRWLRGRSPTVSGSVSCWWSWRKGHRVDTLRTAPPPAGGDCPPGRVTQSNAVKPAPKAPDRVTSRRASVTLSGEAARAGRYAARGRYRERRRQSHRRRSLFPSAESVPACAGVPAQRDTTGRFRGCRSLSRRTRRGYLLRPRDGGADRPGWGAAFTAVRTWSRPPRLRTRLP